MTTTATPPEDAPHWARPLYERHVALLGDLAEEGREVARTLARRVAAVDADDSLSGAEAVPLLEGLSRAYGRTARAVRLTLMLQARLIQDLIAFDNKVNPDTLWDRKARTREAKGRVEHIMERVIGRAHDDSEEVERLICETSERLDREDLYGPLLSRPVSELVAMICQDLGLDPDWPRLAGEAWAQAEAAGGAVGWPLKSFPVGDATHVSPSPLRGGGQGVGVQAPCSTIDRTEPADWGADTPTPNPLPARGRGLSETGGEGRGASP